VIPNGEPVGASSTACGRYLDLADLEMLFSDPAHLTQSNRLESPTFGTCGLYDPRQDRYVLTFDITPDTAMFDVQMKEERTRSGVIFRGPSAAVFPLVNGAESRALVRLPRRYVFVDLRQGPMTPERLNLLLDIAEKIAATVPAPFGTAKPTPTDGTDGAGSTTGQSGRVNGS
jgi:hypothetical protein